MDTEKNEEEEKKSGGLKLVGVDNEEMLRKAKESQIEEWDFSQDIEPMRVSSVQSALNRQGKQIHTVTTSSIILKISSLFVYISIIAEIVTLAWVSSLGAASIISNLKNFLFVYEVCAGVMLIDAILVNILFEGSVSLFFCAVFLGFLYPGVRSAHVKGKLGFGGFLSIVYFLSLAGFLGLTLSNYLYYGKILMIEDDSSRVAAVELIDQTWENGEILGDILKQTMVIEGADVQKKKGRTEITIKGKGLYYLDQDVFTRKVTKTVPTAITFVRRDGTVQYTVAAVELDGFELTEIGIDNYWDIILK